MEKIIVRGKRNVRQLLNQKLFQFSTEETKKTKGHLISFIVDNHK